MKVKKAFVKKIVAHHKKIYLKDCSYVVAEVYNVKATFCLIYDVKINIKKISEQTEENFNQEQGGKKKKKKAHKNQEEEET